MQILGVRPAKPARVVLVLDASASMAFAWPRIIQFSAEIVRESPSPTEFALVLFAGNELRTVGFGKTEPEMITEIMSFKDVSPAGHTVLRDAIWKAASMFQPNREGDTIVVSSDGDDNQSKVSPRQLREAMWSRGIRVMFAQISVHDFRTEEERMGFDDARYLAESSGGLLYQIENPQVLPRVAYDFAFEIANYLAVRITLSTPLEKPASLHLEAVDGSGRKRKNIELGFPEKLLPCASLASTQ
jgi:von Willebrand factor type A domain